MVKNIIIGALAISLIFMAVFANRKNFQAEQQKEIAILSEQESLRLATMAREAEAEALKQKEVAEIAREEAIEQQLLAEDARAEANRIKLELADCKKGD